MCCNAALYHQKQEKRKPLFQKIFKFPDYEAGQWYLETAFKYNARLKAFAKLPYKLDIIHPVFEIETWVTKIFKLIFSSLARKTVNFHLGFYLTSFNDEAISKSQNGVSAGNSLRDTMEKLILAQVSISNEDNRVSNNLKHFCTIFIMPCILM